MAITKTSWILGLTGLGLILSWSSFEQAFAYIPPSQYILRKMTASHLSLKTIRIRSQVVAMDGEKESSTRIKVTTWVNLQNGLLKSWATDPEDHELFRLFRTPASYTPVEAVLLGTQTAVVTQTLKDVGIPVRSEAELLRLQTETDRQQAEMEFLARWKGLVAWVIGAKSGPQIWMEKDRFVPMRLIFQPKGDSSTIDVQIDSFRYYREMPYPRWIRVADKTGTPIFREELTDFSVNPGMTEARGTEAHGFTEAGNSASSSTKELVQKYFEWIR